MQKDRIRHLESDKNRLSAVWKNWTVAEGITRKIFLEMRENPVIPDWVHFSGGSTEGMLGR